MNTIPTNILAIEIALSGRTANASSSSSSVPVLVFPRVGGRCCGDFNASPSLAGRRKPSTAVLPATFVTLGLRPRIVSFRTRRAYA